MAIWQCGNLAIWEYGSWFILKISCYVRAVSNWFMETEFFYVNFTHQIKRHVRYYASSLTFWNPKCNWFRIAICVWFHLLFSKELWIREVDSKVINNYFSIVGLLFNRIIIHELGSRYFTLRNQRKSVVPVHPALQEENFWNKLSIQARKYSWREKGDFWWSPQRERPDVVVLFMMLNENTKHQSS